MDRLSILVSRLIKSMAPTKYFVKVPLVGLFMPLIGGIGQLVESPLYSKIIEIAMSLLCNFSNPKRGLFKRKIP